MPLATHVTDRYDAQFLTELTNVRNNKATDVLASKLQTACDDVEFAHFKTYAQLVYDDTDKQHIVVASSAVIAILKHFGAARKADAEAAWTKMVEILRDLAKVTSRKRVKPYTTSQRTAVPRVIEGENPSPVSDQFFEDFNLDTNQANAQDD